jgi:hypothetical protein
VFADSPVVRSASTRALFLTSSAVTAAILLWIEQLRFSDARRVLTPIFADLFLGMDYSGAVIALLILGVTVFLPQPAWLRLASRWLSEHATSVAVGTAVLLSVAALTVYRDHPLSMDEYAVYFQSQVFAAGSLSGRFPPGLIDWLVPKGFQDYFLNVSHATGQVASGYWPSFSLLLTPFTWLGIPWACNPVISAVTLILVRKLALRMFGDQEAAGLAMLLTLASPVFFADGISYYSMPAHLLANTLYALLLVRPTPGKAIAAGIVGSIALTLHNPVPHLLFAVPWIVWMLARENGLRLSACLAVGYLPLCLLLGLGWFIFSRHLILAGAPHPGGAGTLLSSIVARTTPAFTYPTFAILLSRLIGLAKVWLWAVPGLMLLAGVGAWRWRHDVASRLLAASAGVTLFAYLFIPFDQGHGWGFRYFHSAWMALPVLASGALTRAPDAPSGGAGWRSDDVRAFVVSCALLTLLAGVGLRAFQIHDFISEDLSQVPGFEGKERGVVIIDPRLSFYGQDLVQNDPWLRDGRIRMITHGARADGEMMRANFPQMHRISASSFGSVWSSDSPTSRAVSRVSHPLRTHGSGS